MTGATPGIVRWAVTRTAVGEAWYGTFSTRSGRLFQILAAEIEAGAQGWSIEFSEVPAHVLWVTGQAPPPPANAPGDRPIGTRQPTGRGEAHLVIATVQRAVAEFLETRRPAVLKIRGATSQQTHLYLALARHQAAALSALGYRKGPGTSLVAVKPTPRSQLTMAG